MSKQDKSDLFKIIDNRKIALANNLLKWSKENAPEYPWRKTVDPYHIMVSEMLLRRTRASSVPDVYEKFLKKFPTVSSLAKSSVEAIENIIQSLGMKSRSNKMKFAASLFRIHFSMEFLSLLWAASILSAFMTLQTSRCLLSINLAPFKASVRTRPDIYQNDSQYKNSYIYEILY